ncbi:hypothetical protein EI94DRAFT_1742155 [Lactarius quietus]|nr:hypothetical protein EI94DRAFT_1742155 [Lactarius quietus]
MDPSQENSREHLQQAIDAEIESLRESIRALRLRRNALSPVSSLPPEVFTAIFSFLCLPGTSSLDEKSDYRYHLARLRISHVCHRWREIALDHPLLWSHVDLTTLSAAGSTEILVRAKSVPLYLEARVPGRCWDDVRFAAIQKELQARVPNICHLSISAELFRLHRTLGGLVSPAPTLEYLSLFSRGGYQTRITGDHLVVPDALFNGSTPRLSRLKLRNCEISWKSPLLRGLRYLEILSPPADARPTLTAWLDALDELPQLKTLTLHSASPIAPVTPFDVERTVTLPSLTHLEILTSPGDCALALAHLELPALTMLCITATSHHPDRDNMQILLPYFARHAHGPQDPHPLQSVLILSEGNRADILAWTVSDINIKVQDPPTLPAAMSTSTRVALSFTSQEWFSPATRLDVLDAAMAALPLGGLVTLIAQDFTPDKQFWFRHSPDWPLLRRVQLGPVQQGFKEMLLEDDEGRESPLLPSFTELVLVGSLSEDWTLALMMRVEQGVPLELLDLRMCVPRSPVQVRLLSEIVVNVLDPEETSDAVGQMISMWKTVARGPFTEEVHLVAEDYSYPSDESDNDQNGLDSGVDDEDDVEEE